MKHIGWLLALVVVLVGAFTITAYWMDRAGATPPPQLAAVDPASPGASLIAGQGYQPSQAPQVSGGPESAPAQSTRVPNPLFWMVLGALCTAVGILVATRDNRGAGRRNPYRYARGFHG